MQVEQYKFSSSAELKGGSAPADGRAEPSGDRAGRRSRGSVPALPGSILGHTPGRRLSSPTASDYWKLYLSNFS
jgi:hypothetical protein